MVRRLATAGPRRYASVNTDGGMQASCTHIVRAELDGAAGSQASGGRPRWGAPLSARRDRSVRVVDPRGRRGRPRASRRTVPAPASRHPTRPSDRGAGAWHVPPTSGSCAIADDRTSSEDPAGLELRTQIRWSIGSSLWTTPRWVLRVLPARSRARRPGWLGDDQGSR
jgi:hypothetical protein